MFIDLCSTHSLVQRTGGAQETPDLILRSYTKYLEFSLRSLLSQTALRCRLLRTRLSDLVHFVHTASVRKFATFTQARQLGLSKLPLEYKISVFVIFSQPSNTPRLSLFM